MKSDAAWWFKEDEKMVVGQGEQLWTRIEAAAFCRCSSKTLANLASLKQGPPYVRAGRLRGRALYPQGQVEAWLERYRGGELPVELKPKRRPVKAKRRKAAKS